MAKIPTWPMSTFPQKGPVQESTLQEISQDLMQTAL